MQKRKLTFLHNVFAVIARKRCLRGESPAGQIFGFADETHTQCTLPLSKKKMNGRKGEDTHFISFSDSKKQKKEKHGL